MKRLAAIAAAATAAVACGGDSGFDDDLAEALQRGLDRDRRTFSVPGAQAAVVVPEQGTWTGASGDADVERRRAVSDGTMFAVGSITKTFVATLVLELAEQGRLRLDDPLSRWLRATREASGSRSVTS